MSRVLCVLGSGGMRGFGHGPGLQALVRLYFGLIGGGKELRELTRKFLELEWTT